MLFVACSGVIDYTTAHQKDKVQLTDTNEADKKDGKLASNKGIKVGSNLRKRSVGNHADAVNRSITGTHSVSVPHSPGSLSHIHKNSLLFVFK